MNSAHQIHAFPFFAFSSLFHGKESNDLVIGGFFSLFLMICLRDKERKEYEFGNNDYI